MQGRSIGSKRFNVGEAAPQPTRASIYQEENTPLEWTAAHDLRAQLALPQRPAELHPRALRHGLIASQLGLPMLARAEKKQALEEWVEPAAESVAPADAAYSGAGLDWSNNEQTTRYDEWELQKELVTFEETYPGYDTYDEHPRLDFQLPPVAAGHEAEPDQRHELDYAQAAYAPAEYGEHDQDQASSPGSYTYAHSAQPSAARWHSEQPIRRVPERFGAAPKSRANVGVATRTAEPRTATQGSFANPSHTPRSPRAATQAGYGARAPRNTGAGGQARGAAAVSTTQHGTAEPRTAQGHAGFAAHAPQANAHRGAGGTPSHAQLAAHTPSHRGFAAQTHAAPSGASTHAGFSARAHAPQAAKTHNAPSGASTHHGFTARSQLSAHTHTAPSGAATHAGFTARAPQVRSNAGAGAQTRGPQRAVRRYADDEPVVYPGGGSWLKRFVVLLALAGAGYVSQHYYFNHYQRAPLPAPAPPPLPPSAAAIAPLESPAPPAAAEPSEAQAAPAAPESARERRSAARAAVIAERWRERHAGRRGRNEDDTSSDDRDDAPQRSRPYARSSDERDSSYARSRASASASQRDDYADSEASRSERSRSSASANDDYVSDRHAAAQSGTLRINSLPWSQVHIDGQLVGHTPQMNLLLPAGKHRVTLVNSEMQLTKSLTVQITPGNITTHTINLAE